MNLRDFAAGQSCVRCGAQDGTVVLAHYTGVRRHSYGGGFGIKVHDGVGAHLCMTCHKIMDTETKEKSRRWDVSEEMLHLCALTWIRVCDALGLGRRQAKSRTGSSPATRKSSASRSG